MFFLIIFDKNLFLKLNIASVEDFIYAQGTSLKDFSSCWYKLELVISCIA